MNRIVSESGAVLPVSEARYVLWYNLAMAAIMLITNVALVGQGFSLPAGYLWGAFLLQCLLTTGAFLVRRRQIKHAAYTYLAVFVASTLILGLYLYGSGGHTNPIISLLLVPLAISSVLLPWRHTLGLAVMVVGLYTLLTQRYLPLVMDYAVDHSAGHEHDGFMQLHLLGMWLTFAVSVGLICLLVIPLANAVRKQQSLIAYQREKILQDEQLVALATFAASSAHKMGTPLSTLAILVNDMEEFVIQHPEWHQDQKLMAQQIDLCKSILQEMMQKADGLRRNKPEAESLNDVMAHLREQFNLLHPRFALAVDGLIDDSICVLVDPTLDQALLNLLDNAVKASDCAPRLEISVLSQRAILKIRDTGSGIPESIRHQLGEPFVSTRKDGLGLGLFLSHATINRLGGELTLQSGEQGTIIEVSLPLYEHDPGR